MQLILAYFMRDRKHQLRLLFVLFCSESMYLCSLLEIYFAESMFIRVPLLPLVMCTNAKQQF